MDGKKKVAVGLVSGNIIHWDLGNSNIKPREIDMEVYRLAGVLSI